MIKRPEYIKPGDTIGVTAPSFGPSIEPYSLMYPLSKENIENRGYKVIAGETVFKSDGLGISTDPKVTGKELMDFYKREDINAIISAGGGELMCETISNMDFDELKAYMQVRKMEEFHGCSPLCMGAARAGRKESPSLYKGYFDMVTFYL